MSARTTSAASKASLPGILTLLPTAMMLDQVQAGTKYKTTLHMTNESKEPLKVRIKIPDTLAAWVSVPHEEIAKHIVHIFVF